MSTRWNSSYLAWVRLLYLKGWIKILLNVLSCNTDLDSKRDAKRLKQIMITDDEWDLIADLTEVLSVFADATEDLGGSKYVTNSMCTPMLMEIIKVVKPNSSYDQDFDEEENDAFEDNDVEEEQDSLLKSKINEPIITFGLLDEVKLKLYNNIKKYYPTLTTESLIFSILDPRFKRLDFASETQQIKTKCHLQELFNNEKENYQSYQSINSSTQSTTQSTTQSKSSIKRKTLMARLSKPNVVVINEVDEYLQLPEIALDLNPLIWWNEKKESFPILSGLARKYLAVSATSTASERLFSDAGNLLTNKRTRMKPKLFKKMMFLKRNSFNFKTIHSVD